MKKLWLFLLLCSVYSNQYGKTDLINDVVANNSKCHQLLTKILDIITNLSKQELHKIVVTDILYHKKQITTAEYEKRMNENHAEYFKTVKEIEENHCDQYDS